MKNLECVMDDMGKATLDTILTEIRKLSKMIDNIERLLTDLITSTLPEEEISEEEAKELKNALKEVQAGNYVTLEDLEDA